MLSPVITAGVALGTCFSSLVLAQKMSMQRRGLVGEFFREPLTSIGLRRAVVCPGGKYQLGGKHRLFHAPALQHAYQRCQVVPIDQGLQQQPVALEGGAGINNISGAKGVALGCAAKGQGNVGHGGLHRGRPVGAPVFAQVALALEALKAAAQLGEHFVDRGILWVHAQHLAARVPAAALDGVKYFVADLVLAVVERHFLKLLSST